MNIFYLFLAVSFSISISMEQEGVITPKSFLYWALIISSVLPAFFKMKIISINIAKKWKWIIVFFCITFIWNAFHEGVDFVLSLMLMCISWAYIFGSGLTLKINNIAKIFLAVVVAGGLIKQFTEINYYDLIPYIKINNLSEGRVSFAGNIGFAGIFSLLVFMLLVSETKNTIFIKLGLALSIYFIIFSQVRTAWIGMAVFVSMKIILIFIKDKSDYIIITTVIFATILNIIILFFAPQIIGNLNFDIFGIELITQGKGSIDADALAIQMYRPLLWAEQIKQFYLSPYMMGLGSAASNIDIFGGVDVGYGGDTVSYPTRLLAYYGMPALLFIFSTIYALWSHIKIKDSLAICAWPVCYLVMLNWGSLFHPTDAVGILYLLLIFKGSTVFLSDCKGLK